MISNKLNKIILLIVCSLFVQCYTDPFFELTVTVVDQNLNPITGAEIKVQVSDIDSGIIDTLSHINGEVDFFSITNTEGKAFFNFENKAFISVRACFGQNVEDGGLQVFSGSCREGHIYLEEDTNKEISLMVENSSCGYCL